MEHEKFTLSGTHAKTPRRPDGITLHLHAARQWWTETWISSTCQIRLPSGTTSDSATGLIIVCKYQYEDPYCRVSSKTSRSRTITRGVKIQFNRVELSWRLAHRFVIRTSGLYSDGCYQCSSATLSSTSGRRVATVSHCRWRRIKRPIIRETPHQLLIGAIRLVRQYQSPHRYGFSRQRCSTTSVPA